MSENEKRLRQEIHETKQNAGGGELWIHVRLAKMTEALDALLAEHRAEVERLTREIGRVGRDWRVRWMNDVSSARDAALEEATATGVKAVRSWMGGKGPGLACDTYVEQEMHALKSNPGGRYIPESEVRDVLRERVKVHREIAGVSHSPTAEVLVDAARLLGVEIDTESDDAAIARGEANQTHWTGETATEENGLLPKRRTGDGRYDACGCGCFRQSHVGDTGPCIINGCECSGFLLKALP